MKTGRLLIISALLLALALAGGLVVSLTRSAEQPAPALTNYQTQYIDGPAMLNFTETLSSDALEGRRTGSEGAEAARGFILKRFETLGLEKVDGSYLQPFQVEHREDGEIAGTSDGENVLGLMPGRTPGEGPMLVITAHYDHLGIVDGEIYNGADDNASGVAAMIAIAEYFKRNPPRHDVLFAALDAEEVGLQGAYALVRSPVIDPARGALNLNFDMVSRSAAGELYVAGGHHQPDLLPLIERVQDEAPVTLIAGHDDPEPGADDWTGASDHGAFHEAGYPFLYFGVEVHEGYHAASDDYVNLSHDFFLRAGDTLALAAREADAWLDRY